MSEKKFYILLYKLMHPLHLLFLSMFPLFSQLFIISGRYWTLVSSSFLWSKRLFIQWYILGVHFSRHQATAVNRTEECTDHSLLARDNSGWPFWRGNIWVEKPQWWEVSDESLREGAFQAERKSSTNSRRWEWTGCVWERTIKKFGQGENVYG